MLPIFENFISYFFILGESTQSAIFGLERFQHDDNMRSNETDGLPTYEEAVAKVAVPNGISLIDALNR